MVSRSIEIEDETQEYFERVAQLRGRTIQQEIEVLLGLLLRDSAYLNHLECKIHYEISGEEWKDCDQEGE